MSIVAPSVTNAIGELVLSPRQTCKSHILTTLDKDFYLSKMLRTVSLYFCVLSLFTLATAQFQFFEQMFQGGGQQQQQQQQQNVASDSVWYQQTYDSGTVPLFLPLSLFHFIPSPLPVFVTLRYHAHRPASTFPPPHSTHKS